MIVIWTSTKSGLASRSSKQLVTKDKLEADTKFWIFTWMEETRPQPTTTCARAASTLTADLRSQHQQRARRIHHQPCPTRRSSFICNEQEHAAKSCGTDHRQAEPSCTANVEPLDRNPRASSIHVLWRRRPFLYSFRADEGVDGHPKLAVAFDLQPENLEMGFSPRRHPQQR